MSGSMGTFRRVIAGLLALVLLALPGPVMRHASAATLAQQAAAEHCVSHAGADMLTQATPMHAAHVHMSVVAEPGQPCGTPGDNQGLPCCVAAQCVVAIGALPPSQAGPVPSSGAVIRYLAPAHARFGIEVPPSLPPPRRLG